MDTEDDEASVVRWRATLRAAGRDGLGLPSRVVIHRYQKRDRHFIAAVELAKRTWNPYILSTLGYSRPDEPYENFIVTEEYESFKQYSTSFHGAAKVQLMLRTIKDMLRAIDHLERLGLTTYRSQSGDVIPGLNAYRSVLDYSLYKIGTQELAISPHEGNIKLTHHAAMVATSNSYMVIPATRASRNRVLHNLGSSALQDMDTRSIADMWSQADSTDLRSFLSQYIGVWVANPERGIRAIGDCVKIRTLNRTAFDHQTWSTSGEVSTVCVEDIEYKYSPAPFTLPGSSSIGFDFEGPRAHPGMPDFWDRFATRQQYCDPEDDAAGAFIEFGVGTYLARWKRYPVNNVSSGNVLAFVQRAKSKTNGLVRALCALSETPLDTSNADLGVVHKLWHFVETTLTSTAEHSGWIPTGHASPTYFFMLEDDNSQGFRNLDIPRGFWSAERTPAVLPADVTADPRPRFEHIESGVVARLFTWTQILRGFHITIQAKTMMEARVLSEDEWLLVRELRGNPAGFHSEQTSDPGNSASWYASVVGRPPFIWETPISLWPQLAEAAAGGTLPGL